MDATVRFGSPIGKRAEAADCRMTEPEPHFEICAKTPKESLHSIHEPYQEEDKIEKGPTRAFKVAASPARIL